MALTKEEIEHRIPLWSAMSVLWVDNEIDDFDFHNLSEKMAESKFSSEKLECVFLREVAPACWGNLVSWSVWTVFDEEKLVAEILRNIERQERNFLYRLYIASPFAKFLMTKAIWQDWEKAKTLYRRNA